MGTVYWLLELHTPGASALFYTSPGNWGSNAQLATKYHTQAAADAEARYLRIPDAPHEVVAVDHLWCD